MTYDKTLDKMLIKAESEEAKAINNSLVRKHFRSLTTEFMKAFDDYFKN